MTDQALKALKESIEHWRRLAAGKPLPGESVGASHCALCREFNPQKMPLVKSWYDRCVGCPVFESGVSKDFSRKYCRDTPYDTIENTIDGLNEREIESWLDTDEAKALAAEELAFLESLLPDS